MDATNSRTVWVRANSRARETLTDSDIRDNYMSHTTFALGRRSISRIWYIVKYVLFSNETIEMQPWLSSSSYLCRTDWFTRKNEFRRLDIFGLRLHLLSLPSFFGVEKDGPFVTIFRIRFSYIMKIRTFCGHLTR